MDTSLTFNLYLDHDQCMEYYQGNIQNVLVVAHNGQSIQFPFNIIRQFMTSAGISGIFKIYFDNNYRFDLIERLQ